MYSKNQQELNFLDLQSSVIRPAVSLKRSSATHRPRYYFERRVYDHLAASLLIEAIGWLSLASLFGFIAKSVARDEITRLRLLQGDLETYMRDWGSLWDQHWAPVLDRSVVEGQLDLPLPVEAAEASACLRVFEAYYFRCQDLMASSNTAQAIATLSFDQHLVIEEIIKNKSSLGDVALAAARDSRLTETPSRRKYRSPGPLFAGFGNLLSFVESLHRAELRLAIEDQDNAKLIRRTAKTISRLMRWRLVFLEGNDLLPEFLRLYVDALEIDDDEMRELAETRIDLAIRNWRGLVLYGRAAGAG